MANNNQKKRRENYFQQNINRYGKDFLETYQLDKMRLDAVKVFRELSRGNIDLEIYGKYFYNEKFLEACIATAQTKYNFHSELAMGMQLRMQQNVPGPNTYAVYDFESNAVNAYGLILSLFVEFKNTGDLNILNTLVLNLTKYRYYI